jgi:monofunctional chorismate mutase
LHFGVKMKLEDSRRKIDAIDTEILILLKRRAEVSREIGAMKMSAGLPVIDQRREDDIIRRLARENDGAMGDSVVIGIYKAILRESRRIQMDALIENAAEIVQ